MNSQKSTRQTPIGLLLTTILSLSQKPHPTVTPATSTSPTFSPSPAVPSLPTYKYPPPVTSLSSAPKGKPFSLSLKKKTRISSTQLFGNNQMAEVSIAKALVMMVVVLMAVVAAASAQESPSPSPDAGAGFSLPVSGAMVAVALVLSSVALLRHYWVDLLIIYVLLFASIPHACAGELLEGNLFCFVIFWSDYLWVWFGGPIGLFFHQNIIKFFYCFTFSVMV